MIPSTGFARARPALVFQKQTLSRSPVCSIPRQVISRPSISSPRQFATSLRRNDTPLPCALAAGFLSGRRATAAGILPSQPILPSTRRFDSTSSTTAPSSAAPAPVSELDPDGPGFSSFSDLDPASILNVPEHVGYLANLGIDYGWGPTTVCQWVVEHLHFDLGMPWWAAIVGVATVTRLALLYPVLLSQIASHKSQQLGKDPVYADRFERFLAAAAGAKTDPGELLQLRQQIKHLRLQAGVRTVHMLLPLVQLPFAFGTFKLTRAMAALPVPGLEAAGTLWFPDLTVADPLYLLPCVSAVLMYHTMKISLPFMNPQMASMAKYVPWVLGPLSIIVTLKFPAAVQLYIAAAAALGWLQSAVMQLPSVRRLVGLRELEVVNPAYTAGAHAARRSRVAGRAAPRTLATTATERTERTERTETKTKTPAQSPLAAMREWKDRMMKKGQAYSQASAKQADERKAQAEKKSRDAELERYRARVARQLKRAGRK